MEQKPEPTNKPEAMNLRQAKDEIALKYGYENWLQFEKECPGHMSMQNFCDEAAELYARTKCREQRKLCAENVEGFADWHKKRYIDHKTILNAPAPEFKA